VGPGRGRGPAGALDQLDRLVELVAGSGHQAHGGAGARERRRPPGGARPPARGARGTGGGGGRGDGWVGEGVGEAMVMGVEGVMAAACARPPATVLSSGCSIRGRGGGGGRRLV